MRRSTGLNPNQARRSLLDERQHMATFQLTAANHITVRGDAMNLKNRLCDIETDRRNRLHGLAPTNRGRLTAPSVHGTLVPVEEPSTASLPDSCSAACREVRP